MRQLRFNFKNEAYWILAFSAGPMLIGLLVFVVLKLLKLV